MTMTATEKPATNGAVPTIQPPQGKAAQIVVHDNGSFANLLDTGKFEHMWRVAQVFSVSGMVPKLYHQKPEACFVAIQMAVRLEVDPMMFMQNTYMSPDGKPALYGQLAIALVNARGPFRGPIQFTLDGAGDTRRCVAWQISKSTGERCEVTVDVAMAKAEGWYNRNPKWKSITDMMLRYRAGAWLGRVYAPECLMGMQTAEEVEDVHGVLAQEGDGAYAPRPTRAQVAATTMPDTSADDAVTDPTLDREYRQAMSGQVDTDEDVRKAEEAEAGSVIEPAMGAGNKPDWPRFVKDCTATIKAMQSQGAILAWRDRHKARLDTMPPTQADQIRQAIDEQLADPSVTA